MVWLLGIMLAQSVEIEAMGNFTLPYQADYVGSERCGGCHSDLIERQRTHHMAQTARPAEASDPLFSIPGKPGQSIPRPDELAAILGSGIHAVTPIRAAPNRRIREDLMSYSEVLGSWFRTPGTEDVDDPLGNLKTVEGSRECLACHATTIAWRDDVLDPLRSDLGIQCERCHGPGSAHIDAMVNGSPSAAIFNPSALTNVGRVLFCAQCHRQPIDMEPVEVLGHVASLARHAGVGHMMSACFRKSPREQTLTCTDCHSPHANAAPSADGAVYRDTCLRCHTDPAPAHTYERITPSSDCIACHMPKESEGFYGMTFTDHWIQVPGARAPLGGDREREDLDYLELLYRNEWEIAGIGEERRSRLALGLAEIVYGLGRHEDAFVWVRESVSRSPMIRQRLKAAAMLRDGGKLGEAESVLRDAIDLDPDLLRAHFDLGEIAAERGALEEATAHYRRALAIRDDFAEGQVALGAALSELHRWTEALEHFRRAEELIGDTVRVATGIAWILATHPDPESREPREALRLAEQAAAATGYANPIVLDSLAAAYAASGDLETAQNALSRAIAIAAAAADVPLAAKLRERLLVYESGKPFVSPPEPD